MVKIQPPKLVLWDLDGTLIDSFGVYVAIVKEAAELGGRECPSEESIRHNFHGSLSQTLKDTMQLVDGDDLDRLLNDFLRIQERYYKEPEEHLHQDALRLSERLKAKQVVVTNRFHEGRGNASPRYLVENSSLSRLIDEVIPGDEAPAPKPSAEVISNIEYVKNVASENILVIGDQFVDAELAHNLGAQMVLINRNSEPVPHLERLTKTDHILQVSSLDEVELA